MRHLSDPLPIAAILALSFVAAGCDGGRDPAGPPPPPVSAPSPTPTPAPTPTPSSFNVTRCINQSVAPGVTVANLVVPDTLTLNLNQPPGFPNGRRLQDPVIDITLAVIFLDLTRHSARFLADLPLGPSGNDVPFRPAFPYLAAPQGNPTLLPLGANFDFRADPPHAYVRVDRMGMPAVATALISSPAKVPYNDDSPVHDVTGKWVPELTSTLISFTGILFDDFERLNLSPCATRG